MRLAYDVFETPMGWMGVVASDRGLTRTTLPQPAPDVCIAMLGPEIEEATPSPQRLLDLKTALNRYFESEEVTFGEETIDVEDASPFMRAASEACSYKWLAAQAGRPQAPRAAGQSMARNRPPIIVPCHRVVAGDGSLRGFGKGSSQLGLKQRLLDLESRPQ